MKNTKVEKRARRKLHIRKNVNGTATKPRIFVFKSNKYFYAGIADDEKNIVLKSVMCKKNAKGIKDMATIFGKEVAKFDSAVFDRSGYRYHGLIQIFADELRGNGVKI
ncbi:50S ribosomal protein L18 [Patescibacteria group bacterium]|nr:50S ribosomal protein L18 [Patescibacteria group bacterium]